MPCVSLRRYGLCAHRCEDENEPPQPHVVDHRSTTDRALPTGFCGLRSRTRWSASSTPTFDPRGTRISVDSRQSNRQLRPLPHRRRYEYGSDRIFRRR
uniref:Uncharacterized protein n=1 Tax=Leersia perrieri TaxID=77586 RepID=A0A0D9W8V8_9ORYZ